MEVVKEMKLGLKVAYGDEDDARTSNTHIAHQRKRAMPHSTMKNNRNMTCVLVMALCNQPKACAADLGDEQSRYSFIQAGQNAVCVCESGC